MPVIGGLAEGLIVAVALVVAVILWLIRGRRQYPGPRLLGENAEIDQDELEDAEREVRELDSDHRPDDDVAGDDWGPGTARPRPPVRL
jgi:beta-lactam-binding protein with PASTA domain